MDLGGRRGLALLAFGARLVGHASAACRSSTATCDRAGSRRRSHHRARRARHPGHHRRHARRSRLRHRVTRTRRTASSRWICRAGSRPASCRSCSARWRSSRTRRTRRFGFRAVARRVIEAAPAEERAIIEAYTRGVNAGLASLATRARGNTCCCARSRANGCRKIRCWWCTRCGGSCSTARCATRSTGAAWSAPRPPRGDAGAAHELITFVYAGHSDWDTPNYSADARCVQAACTRRRRACSRGRSRRCCASRRRRGRSRRTKPQARQQQLGGGRHPHALGCGADRQRHASRPRRAGRLVSGAPARHGRARHRRHRRDLPGTPAVAAGSNGQVAWGFTNSYGDFADVRFGQVREPRLRRAPRAHRGDAAPTTCEVEYRDVGAGVVLDGEEYADDVESGECLQAAWLATRPEATNFGLLAMERARNIDDVLALAPRRRHSRAEPGGRRCRRAHRLDLVRPRAARTAGPIACSARSSFAMPSIIRASPIRRWAGCGPRISAWSTDRSRRCSATTRSTWAPAATTSARARARSATTCWA